MELYAPFVVASESRADRDRLLKVGAALAAGYLGVTVVAYLLGRRFYGGQPYYYEQWTAQR